MILYKKATPTHNKIRKDDIEYKRSLIVKWRNMINEVIKEKDEDEAFLAEVEKLNDCKDGKHCESQHDKILRLREKYEEYYEPEGDEL